MSDGIQELQKFVFSTLLTDSELVSTLGGPKIFDHVPERVAHPYIVLGRCIASDWSTSTEDGQALTFFIHIWSKSKSRAEINSLQEKVKLLLTDHPNLVGQHCLAALRFQLVETRRDRPNGFLHSVLRFRAVLEPNI